jgi:pimeloyl-ACP methyl ester carboxylesterase
MSKPDTHAHQYQLAANDPLLQLPAGSVDVLVRPDGTRIRSVSRGHGPTVVLAHGYLLDLMLFNLVFDALVSAGHRVIAFDQRGHGASTIGSDGLGSAALASDYAALLDHYAVEDGTLVAHSMGAFLSIVLCLREPALVRRRLRKLVLIGGNAGSVAQGSLQNRIQIPLLRFGLSRRLWEIPRAGRPLVAQLFGPDADPRHVEATRLCLLRQREQRSFPMLNAMLHENYYARLGEIPLPVSVLCGEVDRTCPRWHSERIGAELAHGRNLWLPRIGHMLPYEAPQALLDTVAAFNEAGSVTHHA